MKTEKPKGKVPPPFIKPTKGKSPPVKGGKMPAKPCKGG